MKFLSESNLSYLVTKLKNLFATKKEVCNVRDSNGVVDAAQVVNKSYKGTNNAPMLVLGDDYLGGYGIYIESNTTEDTNDGRIYFSEPDTGVALEISEAGTIIEGSLYARPSNTKDKTDYVEEEYNMLYKHSIQTILCDFLGRINDLESRVSDLDGK